MPTISDYYKYSALATAAYVRTGNNPLDGTTFTGLAASNLQQRLPQMLADRLFDPGTVAPGLTQWTIESYYGSDVPAYTDDKSGFAATLFKQGNERVLAIRGTEPTEDFQP